MITWIKKLLLKEGIKELNQLKPYISAKIVEAQADLNKIAPEQFADIIVSEIQVAICNKIGIDPKDIGIGEK